MHLSQHERMWEPAPGTSPEAILLPTASPTGISPCGRNHPQEENNLTSPAQAGLWGQRAHLLPESGRHRGTWRDLPGPPSLKGRCRGSRDSSLCADPETLSPGLQGNMPRLHQGRSQPWSCLQVPSDEQGLKFIVEQVATYSEGFKIWLGPTIPLVVFCHPNMIRTISNASGTNAELVGWAPGIFQGIEPLHTAASLPPLQDSSPSSPLLSIFLFPSCSHQPPSHHFLLPLPSAPGPGVQVTTDTQQAFIQGSVLG